jgi:hypothetical protein
MNAFRVGMQVRIIACADDEQSHLSRVGRLKSVSSTRSGPMYVVEYDKTRACVAGVVEGMRRDDAPTSPTEATNP